MSGKQQALSPLLALGGPFKCGFFFLIRLAWDSHTRIPILIAIIFMVCDIRMQLEIDIETAVRHLPRQNNDEEGTDDEDESDSEEESVAASSASSDSNIDLNNEDIAQQLTLKHDLIRCDTSADEPKPQSSDASNKLHE